MEEAQAFSVNVRLSVSLSAVSTILHEEQIEDIHMYVIVNVLLKSLVKIDCDKTMHVK